MKTDNQHSFKPKMRGRKLRIDANWHVALKQKRHITDGRQFGCTGSVNFELHTNTDRNRTKLDQSFLAWILG